MQEVDFGNESRGTPKAVDLPKPSPREEIIAEKLGLSKESVQLGRTGEDKERYEKWEKGEERFYSTRIKTGEDKFVVLKLAKEAHLTELERESAAMEIAGLMAIPTATRIAPYTEILPGEAMLVIEGLVAEEEGILATAEMIARAKPELRLGRAAARAIIAYSGKEIPAEVSGELKSKLRRDEWRYQSPETVRKVWEEGKQMVMASTHSEWRDKVIDGRGLQTIADAGDRVIDLFLQGQTPSDKEYLVNGDLAPVSMRFKIGEPPSEPGERQIELTNWEHAGATQYQDLALMTDLSNYWARCWPNPEMQKEMVNGYLEAKAGDAGELAKAYQLLRAVVIYGSFYLAKYGMDSNHGEHGMSVSLLENLKDNLQALESEYTSIIGSKGS